MFVMCLKTKSTTCFEKILKPYAQKNHYFQKDLEEYGINIKILEGLSCYKY